jgi:hypothetical protein
VIAPRKNSFNTGDSNLYIDNSSHESNLIKETYVDQIINSLKDDLDKFKVIFYDTTNTQIDDNKISL